MFWFLFIVFILIGCVIAYFVDLFEQMKTSEYEIVRAIYWILVVAIFIFLFNWISTW
jgi:hypothetical protein